MNWLPFALLVLSCAAAAIAAMAVIAGALA
jgi:hypothetical protein